MEREIISAIEAMVTARRIARDKLGTAAIRPCDLNNGGISCPDRGDPLRGNLCKHPDGLLPENGGIVCPRQKGQLKIINRDVPR